MASPIVSVEQGKLRGCTGKNYDGEVFYKFHGIPFAKPPLGNLRFKPPVAPEPWDGVRDATKEAEICISRWEITQEVMGSEDCIYLNVYTRQIPKEHDNGNLKPVMLFIHGGAFIAGGSKTELYGPEYLLTEEVVLVTTQYRLGVFGFLSIEDPALDVPGNMGLKDIIAALQWIHKNIQQFGGDPNNVTVFGHSAGAALTHAVVLSPAAKGLFHRAILQSGTALNNWAMAKQDVREIAALLGKNTESSKEALNVLMNATSGEILDAQEKLRVPLVPAIQGSFGLVVEYPNPTAVLLRDPIEIIATGDYNHVPIIMGYTDREALLLKKILFDNNFEYKNEHNIPHFVSVSERTKDMFYRKIDTAYGHIDDAKYDILSDAQFVAHILQSLKRHIKTAKENIYLYVISVTGEQHFLRYLHKIDLPGVCHADELGYIFKMQVIPELKQRSKEEQTMRYFVKLWTNFAKTGNPSSEFDVTWKPVENENHISYLNIDDQLSSRVLEINERIEAWEWLFEENRKEKEN